MRLEVVTIDPECLPEEERNAVTLVQNHLMGLKLQEFAFRVIYGLFEQIYAREKLPHASTNANWEGMGQDGAIAVSTFWQRMESIRQIEAPTLWLNTDIQLLDRAFALFRTEFAGIVKAPLVVAALSNVTSEGQNTDEKVWQGREGAQIEKVKNQVWIRPGGLKYNGSLGKQRLGCLISLTKADVLKTISDLCSNAFNPHHGGQNVNC